MSTDHTRLEVGGVGRVDELRKLWLRLHAREPVFVADGARAYLEDVPNAELHLLDTGHFALATHASEIAEPIASVHARHAAAADSAAT